MLVLLTAHGTIETAVEEVQRGAFDYRTKPFVRDERRAKIGRALAARRWARDRERLLFVGEGLDLRGSILGIAPLRIDPTASCVPWSLETRAELGGLLIPWAIAASECPVIP